MSDANAIRCASCTNRLPKPRPGAPPSSVCPRCGRRCQTDGSPAPASPRESIAFAPASLRRSARLRGIREAGLLLSLIAVMAVTAYYTWQGTVDSTRVRPPLAQEDQPETNEKAPLSPIVAEMVARSHRSNPVPSGLIARGFPNDERSPQSIEFDSPIDEAADTRTKPDLEPEHAKPPSVQAPDDAPRFSIRSPDPNASPDIPLIKDLSMPRPPIDLFGLSPSLGSSSTSSASAADRIPEEASTPDPARRLLVGDASGHVLVSRFHAQGPSGPIVQLPDGSLGWPDGEVVTQRPFRPWSARQLINALRNDRERNFRAIERPPYIVLTEGSDSFAERAADLLQSLYDDLTTCLEEGGIPVHEPEFPLVAVIYRDEHAFRRYRAVDPDVRAYYEVASNRIILYESSEQDLRAPELAALNRPQTIAHEGVHQILQNVGVQPRLANWPPWLVEGLAEYYAPTALPDTGPSSETPKDWGDYGRANFGRVNALHMATLIDLQDPSTLLAHLRGPGPGEISPTWARLGPDEPWVTHLILRSELSPTDYALAWCLTHYLAHKHPDAFREYLLSLSRQPPLEPRSPERHLKDFIAAFGVHPSTLARRIDRHLASLRYDRVPYYAVRFEQAMPSGLTRRGVLVSPSPTMITQWLRAQTLPHGGPIRWWATPFDSRNRARLSCESWLLHPFP